MATSLSTCKKPRTVISVASSSKCGIKSPCQSLESVVKLINDAFSISDGDNRISTACSLQTLQELILCLAASPDSEEISRFDSEELNSLRISTQQVAVLWLSAVPWPWEQTTSPHQGVLLDSFPTFSSAVEISIKCPSRAPSADDFLSSTFLKTDKNSGSREHSKCSIPKLVMSVKDLLANNFPVPLTGEVESDKKRTIKHGQFVYSFQWNKQTFVTKHKDFQRCGEAAEGSPLFAIDCEMVCTLTDQMALGRVSIVDQKGRCVYDSYVKPPDLVTNYLTQYSGIKAGHLENEKTTLKDVQEDLLRLLPKDAVLVGQSLENDLYALRFAHPYVIDTSTIFVRSCYSKKPSLAQLAKEIIGKDLKRGKFGHDSIVDAGTAMELVQAKLSAKGNLMLPSLLSSGNCTDSFFDVLSSLGVASVMIDSTRFVKKYAHPDTVAHKVESDQRALWCLQHLSSAQFGWLQLHSYESIFHTLPAAKVSPDKKLQQIGSAVKFFMSNIDAGTFCVVIFGGSNRDEENSKLLKSIVFIKS